MHDIRPKLLLACTHSLGAKFLEGQLAFMRRCGFDVYVISGPGKEIESLCRKEEAMFLAFPFTRTITPFADFVAVIKLHRMLAKLKPDIINTGTPKSGLLVSLAAKIWGKAPVIFTLRGLRSETLSGFKRTLVRRMEKMTCSLADIVIPISPSLAVHVQQLGITASHKIEVLGVGSSNGIDLEKFTPTLERSNKIKERAALGIGESDFVIAYVGRINNDKGVVELFEAFKHLSNRRDVKLLIVGAFEQEDAISPEIKMELESHPSVILEGYRSNIRNIYEIIDVLVLFSKREGFGNILIEASSMMVPVIASNIPGCRDAVKDGVSGYLVNNSEELLERLKFFFRNQEIAKKYGQQGREWVRKHFDSNIIWNCQLNLYRKMLKEFYEK